MNKNEIIENEKNEVKNAEIAIIENEMFSDDVIDRVTDMEGISISDEEEDELVRLVDEIELTSTMSVTKEDLRSDLMNESIPSLDQL